MRLAIDVCEGDQAILTHSAYGANFSWELDRMIEEGGFAPSDGIGRWDELHRQVSARFFEVELAEAELTGMSVAELTALCLAEARRVGAARPEPVAGQGSSPFEDRVLAVWLADSVLDERLDERRMVADLALADGDLLVLYIEHPPDACYQLVPPPNPAELLRWLQLAENSTAPVTGPRLWGVLLYTEADVELATYVRTHFDDLNVLSGPATRVFVVERRQDWGTAKKYWRRHLEPELYRVLSAMRWLRWTPYDPQGAYEIASLLGLGPEQLPCLVFFRGSQEARPDDDKIVFPIEHTSTAYFRALFGGIATALRTVPETASTDGVQGRPSRREARTAEYFEYRAGGRDSRRYAPADTAMHTLLSSARAADTAAFEALRSARSTIATAMRAVVPPPDGITVSNSHIILETAGAALSENFYFQGQNTTFINRPQDTVVQDFQNTHGAAVGADDLTRLLRLVLSSGDMAAADREEAAATIHDLARIGSTTQPDPAAAGTRLERLRSLLVTGADIAQPALAILASLTAFLGG
ncbi:hypothetical protein ACGFX8_21640 [Streptomyces sp. NPDC048362]|uniref:hypothetical protein n=1 Tax=Streptomyces sp. NPDC048362 TaxID=3365539 RepID=UPI003721F48F